MGALLAVSLALNLLICGALVGSVLTGKRHGGGGMSGRGEIGIRSFVRQLPAERRKALEKVLKQGKGDLRPLRAAVIDARLAAAAALAADPLDPAAVRREFDVIDAADAKLRATAREAIIKTVESMTPDERRDLSAWWRQRKAHLFRMQPARDARREKPVEAP